MIPFAIGEQTRGSILRPASYCGITGFKPTYNLLPMEGVLPLSKSLDTLGFFTHTAKDMLALWEAIGHPTGSVENFALAAPDPLPRVEPAMAAAFKHALPSLRSAGLSIKLMDIAPMLVKLSDASNTVMFYEGARFHHERFKEYGSRLADLADLVREGIQIPAVRYNEAMRYIADCRARFAEIYKETPVILSPAATGPAPQGLSSTGDASMNAPWTALGCPAMSIPLPVASGLPLGLQITADRGQDARVLRTAVRVESILRNA
jgi:Asp-tRNA(Asn)/Glu-tRNA(Gln) amidotransferase A subunit family amidase